MSVRLPCSRQPAKHSRGTSQRAEATNRLAGVLRPGLPAALGSGVRPATMHIQLLQVS